MELHNLASKREFEALERKAAAGLISREEYIRQKEEIEYNNVKKTKAAMKEIAPKHTSIFDDITDVNTFDEYYDKVNDDHKEIYGKWWDDHYGPRE